MSGVNRARSDSLEVLIAVDDDNLLTRRGKKHIVAGTLDCYRGIVKDPQQCESLLGQKLDPSQWASANSVLSDNALCCGSEIYIPVCSMKRVAAQCELGDFVFQIHVKPVQDGFDESRTIYTLRAASYSDMVDWCDALRHLMRHCPQDGRYRRSPKRGCTVAAAMLTNPETWRRQEVTFLLSDDEREDDTPPSVLSSA